MKIMIISSDGEILDSEEISREDFEGLSPAGAYALLTGLSIGDAR